MEFSVYVNVTFDKNKNEEKGENGFGYDPIFFLPEYGCTSAELSMEEKNKISHRGKALRAMKELLIEQEKKN